MAYSVALRRATAAAAPLAARTTKAKPAFLRTVLLRNILPLQKCPSTLSHFSPLSTKQQQSSDGDLDLVGVLDSEIKFASDDYKKAEKLPKGFPFEIEDAKGTSVIVLRRMYGREEIEVLVSIPSLVAGDEAAAEDDENSDEFEDKKTNEEDGDGQFCIPLTVNVSKGGGGPSLELGCTGYPDEIEIDAVSLKSDGDCEGVSYEGPRFKKLQKALHKYLERRGISPFTTNLLYEYMINKDNREYLLWLKNLRRFMEE